MGDVIIATVTLEHDYNNKFSNRPKPQFAGDLKIIEQIKALNLSDADFKVHFGIMAGGDEDVIDIKRGTELKNYGMRWPLLGKELAERVLLRSVMYLTWKSVVQPIQRIMKRLLCSIST